MKLIYCPDCSDILRLTHRKQYCICKKSWGKYTDHINAVIGGNAIPIGINNSSFVDAIWNRPQEGLGSRFEAFVIPKICPTVEQK
jgi:hypothetical protein